MHHGLRLLPPLAAAAADLGAVSGTIDLNVKAVDSFAEAAALDGRRQPGTSAPAVGCYQADVE